MNPRPLTDAEYAELKIKLHHAHDKIIRVTLLEDAARREFTEKIVMPHLNGLKIDLDNLQIDTTSYTNPSLQAFYSDFVYLTSLVDETTDAKEPITVALLIEHKSKMPTPLFLRLQLSEYINSIMKMNYNKDTDSTIPVLSIIFNQFDKGWEAGTFRGLFPKVSYKFARFILEFDMVVINLADLPDALMNSLDKYGLLKATLLAMKNVRNKEFLKLHFEEIFLFLHEHPEKIDLRTKLVAYIIGQSALTHEEIQELINNIFSPVLKEEITMVEEGFMAVAAREARTQAKAEAKIESEVALQFQRRLTVMLGWNSGASLDSITIMASLPKNEVIQLVAICEKVKTYCAATKKIDKEALKNLSGLNENELTALVKLLTQQ